MSDRRWEADTDDDGPILWWTSGPTDPHAWGLTADDLELENVGFGDKAAEAFAALHLAVARDAEVRKMVAGWHKEPLPAVGSSADTTVRRIAVIHEDNQ